jgi:hypothetical protein
MSYHDDDKFIVSLDAFDSTLVAQRIRKDLPQYTKPDSTSKTNIPKRYASASLVEKPAIHSPILFKVI